VRKSQSDINALNHRDFLIKKFKDMQYRILIEDDYEISVYANERYLSIECLEDGEKTVLDLKESQIDDFLKAVKLARKDVKKTVRKLKEVRNG
tara:strand:+ start:345 stop:623 length:279 start_codon:yes stop_codon:yes gene_type:complete